MAYPGIGIVSKHSGRGQDFTTAKVLLPDRGPVTETGKCVVKSGNEFCHLFPELGRRLARLLFKDRCKIGFFVIAKLKPDLGDGFPGLHQEVLCFDEFAGLDNFGNALLKNIAADQVQVAGGHEKFGGIKVNPFRPPEIVL